jgi:hypothetical protein
MTAAKQRVIASCSFCLKPSDEVKRLVAGPGVYIPILAAWRRDAVD